MVGPSNHREWPDIDEVVEAYESAQASQGWAELADFAPPREHPAYLSIVCELVRVDMEYSWQRGRPRGLDYYRGLFPALFDNTRRAEEIAFEESRLRREDWAGPPLRSLRTAKAVDPTGIGASLAGPRAFLLSDSTDP